MSRKTSIHASVRVDRPATEVFGYLSDFRRAPEWRAEVVETTQTPDGPMVVGTGLHEVSRILGRQVVTDSIVERLDDGRRFTFTHVAGPIPVGGTWSVEPDGSGSRVDYELTAELRGVFALAAPYLDRWGPRMFATSLAALRDRLEAAPSTG